MTPESLLNAKSAVFVLTCRWWEE